MVKKIILSGDIGGTTTRLQLTAFGSQNNIKILYRAHYRNNDFANLLLIIDTFFVEANVATKTVKSACFAVAGPIQDNIVKLTNLPWVIKTQTLMDHLDLVNLTLINDFQGIGYGLELLTPNDLYTFQQGKPSKCGLKIILGAGTGFGIAILTHDINKFTIHPSEGGHIDFAPVDDIQIKLLNFMLKKYERVSVEHVLSGPGLVNIYQFVCTSCPNLESLSLQAALKDSTDKAATITEYAISYNDICANRALDIFINIYGATIGNLALLTLPHGGIYVSGGIALKILPQILKSKFMERYYAKGRLSYLLEIFPLYLITNEYLALQGAALYAKSLL
jgi:glucokinase